MKRFLFLVAALAIAPLTASAHHSYSMFDMDKTVVLDASVVRFKWQNPHAFIEADVAAGGATERWAIEMTSPNNLVHAGWRRSSLKPGDKVTVEYHPLRNGKNGGALVQVTLANGTVLKNS